MSGYKGGETTGFQSPAQDHIEEVVDLSALLDLRKPGMYPVRVVGQALKERGIDHNDILIADATADPEAGRVCVAMFGGEVILATLKRKSGEWFLLPSKGELVPVTVDVDVWAIIRALVRMDV